MKKRIFYPILLLTGLMPFHNLMVQYATKILRLPESLVFWKDWLVGILILILIWESFGIIKKLGFNNIIKGNWSRIFLPLVLIAVLNIFALLSSSVFNAFNLRAFVSGYYFELWWLDFFAILMTWFQLYLYEVKVTKDTTIQNTEGYANSSKFDEVFKIKGEVVSISNNFLTQKKFGSHINTTSDQTQNVPLSILKKQLRTLKNVICIGFTFTALISCASLLIGQEKVLSMFGYANNTESVGLVGNSLSCHPIDYNVAGCRLSGTLSHPIHYAAYLLLVLPVLVVGLIDSKNKSSKVLFGSMLILNLFLIYETYSRYALLTLPLFVLILIIYLLRNQLLGFKLIFAKFLVVVCLILPIFVSLVFVNIRSENLPSFLPKSITKPSSTIWHYYHFMAGIKTLETLELKALTGVGMGQSGSAARSKYQDLQKNTLYKIYGKIAYDWNLTEESFLLVENWYLQTILNNGWIYALVYILMTLLPLAGFWQFLFSKNSSMYIVDTIFGLGFFAVIIGNQLEHLWENQTVVMFWVLVYFYAKVWTIIQKKV